MKETTITAIFIGIVIFLVIVMIFLCSYTAINNKGSKLFEYISTEKVYKIWDETSLFTDMHFQAYKELEKRGYWDVKYKKAEIESIEIYNKYK